MIMEVRPGPPSPIPDRSGGLVLALGDVALLFRHGGKALTLAGVQALAGMVAALAGTLSLTGVGADALAFAGGVACGRHGRTGQEQGGCSGGNGSAGFRSKLHEHFLQMMCRCTRELRWSWLTGRTQRYVRPGLILVTRREKIIID